MAYRTPQNTWDDVNFIEDGELGGEEVFNRPLAAIDDKAEYLRALVTEVRTWSTKLSTLLGENLDTECDEDHAGLPCWIEDLGDVNATHHDIIEAIIELLKLVQTASTTNSTHISNVANKVGFVKDDSDIPEYSSHEIIADGDTHHTALEKLDFTTNSSDDEINRVDTGILARLLELETKMTAAEANIISNLAAITGNQANITDLQDRVEILEG